MIVDECQVFNQKNIEVDDVLDFDSSINTTPTKVLKTGELLMGEINLEQFIKLTETLEIIGLTLEVVKYEHKDF